MKVRSERDFWSGVMFFIVGLGFAIGAANYGFGTAQQMGPAYFPAILGGLLAVIGVIVGLASLGIGKHEDRLDRFHFSSIAWIAGAVGLFAVLLKPAGLLVSLVVLVTGSMLGSHEFRWKEAVVASLVLTGIVWAVFIYGLKLTIPIWPVFIVG